MISITGSHVLVAHNMIFPLSTLIQKRKYKKHAKQGGYMLLLAMLIMSIVMAISFSIYEISLKEVELASFIKESQRALIAADRAAECALFWDRSSLAINGVAYTIFATSSVYANPPTANLALCHDGTALRQLNTLPSWTVSNLTPTTGRTVFSLSFSDGTCADVTVDKNDVDTAVNADGYNTCSATAVRRTQRTIQIFSNI